MTVLTTEEIHQQIYDAMEKDDLNTLKTLLEPPLGIDTILSDIYVLLNGNCTRKPPLLLVAAAFGDLDIVQYLISQGANPNRFPLHFAILKKNIDIVKELISAHAEVNKQDWDNYSPLHFCAQTGFVEGAILLLSSGAAINIQSRKKETPLSIAVQNDQFGMVKFLIESHADVQKSAIAPVATILIESGASIDHKDDDGLTPLQSACERGCVDAAKVLIEKGADVNSLDSQKVFFSKINQTPLHKAVENNHIDIVNLLLQSNAQIKVLDSSRQTPEAIARAKKYYDILEIISSFKQKVDASFADFRAQNPNL